MNCPNCQQPLPANAHFCGACGTQLGQSAAMAGGATQSMPGVATPGVATPGVATPPHTSGVAALLDRVKNILLTPKTEWQVIEPEATTIAQVYTGYVMPLAAVAAVLSFIHMSVLGISLPFGAGNLRMPMTAGLTSAVMTFVFGLIGLFLLAAIINGLAPTFGGQKDQRQAVKVAAYAFTPGYLSALLALSPILPTLLQFVAGCYGIYLLALGLPVLMHSPRDKAFGYTASVVVCSILVGFVFAFVSASVMHVTGVGPTFGNSQDAGAAMAGNMIGNALGTDAQGKAGLGAALNNLVQAGKQQEAAESTRQAAVTRSNAIAAAAGADTSTGSAAASPADGAQNAMGAAGGLLTALGGALGGGKRVDAVDYHTLTSMLPTSLPGMTRVTAGGESNDTIGIKSSKSTARYTTAEGKTAEIEIADLSGVSGLMELANGLQQSTTTESDTGYEKQVVLNGRSAHETFNKSNGHGEVAVTLAKRYQVTASGDGIPMATLEQAVNAVDLSKLEGMKDVGAHAQ